MKKIIEKMLVAMARSQVHCYGPIIIGVTGNAGKTSAKEAIAAVLGHEKKIRVSAGNLNNEIGFALTILGDWDAEYYNKGPGLSFWARVFLAGIWGTIFGRNFPEVLLLEYGADHPGDIKRLAAMFPPQIAVVTTVGETPVHIEFFKNADALADEKTNLVRALDGHGHAVLNQDDARVLAMAEKTKAHTIMYGFNEGATIRASDFDYRMEADKPTGVTFKLNTGASTFVPVVVYGSLGKSQAYAAAAAAAVGTVLGLNLVQIADGVSRYHGPKGRLKIIAGIRGSTVIDDTYNASPASTRLALETLRDLQAKRKIAVLGNMLELGSHSEKAHREIGEYAAGVANILVCVGEHARAIADAAKKLMPAESVFWFENSIVAKIKVREIMGQGDLVLVKGSQGARMERIVAEIMAEPERKKELLVRQSQNWLAK